MAKISFQELKDFFSFARVSAPKKETKHQASKKGYKHQHNLSKGQMKDYQKRMDANQKWFS